VACAGDVVSPGGLRLAVRVGEIVIGSRQGGQVRGREDARWRDVVRGRLSTKGEWRGGTQAMLQSVSSVKEALVGPLGLRRRSISNLDQSSQSALLKETAEGRAAGRSITGGE